MKNTSRLWIAAMGLGLLLALMVSPAFANAGPPEGKPASNSNNPVSHDETKSDHKSAVAKEHESPVAREHDGPSGGDVQ